MDRETPSVAVTVAGTGGFVSGISTQCQDLERTNTDNEVTWFGIIMDVRPWHWQDNLSKVSYIILLLYGEARNHIIFALA